MTISAKDLAKLTDKSSRDPEIVKLYQENDFLTAYAAHTDRRIEADPQLAIGGDWEEYGNLQRDFLIAQGLRPEHRFLDVGCGTGRLARKIVPYLNIGNYTGVDISRSARHFAHELAVKEGWGSNWPMFTDWAGLAFRFFDFAWAFSVFIHLPSEQVRWVLAIMTHRLNLGGMFFFSYVPTDLADDTRTGLKQFKHPLSFYESAAAQLGHPLWEVPWPGRQRILVMKKV